MEILDVSNNNKECRICFLTETDNPDMEFINPCALMVHLNGFTLNV